MSAPAAQEKTKWFDIIFENRTFQQAMTRLQASPWAANYP
jgi:hypothetical protein